MDNRTELPEEIPLFPLAGVLLLPHGILPLHIFEPRYVAMVQDALSTASRLIGMIQPEPNSESLFVTGCAGRIISFEETVDGRYMIALRGISRFTIIRETTDRTRTPYRTAKVNWQPFTADTQPLPHAVEAKEHMLCLLKKFFVLNDMRCDWEMLKQTDDEKLLSILAMICPFSPLEKQALLEAETVQARTILFTELLTMAVCAADSKAPGKLH